MRNAECGIAGKGRVPYDASLYTPHSALRIPHSASSESAFELSPRKLNDGRPPVHVVGRQGGAEAAHHALPHRVLPKPPAGLDRGAAVARGRVHAHPWLT